MLTLSKNMAEGDLLLFLLSVKLNPVMAVLGFVTTSSPFNVVVVYVGDIRKG
jgi:hypothetical protein